MERFRLVRVSCPCAVLVLEVLTSRFRELPVSSCFDVVSCMAWNPSWRSKAQVPKRSLRGATAAYEVTRALLERTFAADGVDFPREPANVEYGPGPALSPGRLSLAFRPRIFSCLPVGRRGSTAFTGRHAPGVLRRHSLLVCAAPHALARSRRLDRRCVSFGALSKIRAVCSGRLVERLNLHSVEGGCTCALRRAG